LIEEARRVGIPVRQWNEWIREYAENGKVDLYGAFLTEVEGPSCLGKGQSIAVHDTMEQAEQALERRSRAICDLVRLAASQPSPPSSTTNFSGRQRRILLALAEHGPMGGVRLAHLVRCDRRTLYKPGGLRELIAHGLVTRARHSDYRITKEGRATLAEK
jgi:hypothetical protein